jgi:serine/threonine protein kinase
MIGETISHYRIVEKIGEGGMGVVYVAEDILLGRRVAIKTLTAARGSANQHFRMRFLREAQAVSKLSHPHIATIHDYGETENGRPYIVMELVEGKTLSDLMRDESLTIPQTVQIVRQVADALSEAHRHGIVHRDIKPSNIAVNERGVVKVLDFGLAKQLVPVSSPRNSDVALAQLNTQTREGLIVGTPLYLSPEQALGADVDARSDLFSLGSVLYECIAGRPAFAGKSDIDICAKVIRDDPPPPSDFNGNVPRDLDRITLKALAKQPEARYQTATDMIADLSATPTKTQKGASDQTVTRLLSPVSSTQPSSALATLSDILKRPRLSIGYVVCAAILVFAIIFVISRWTRATLPKPSPEAQKWYDIGTNDLRDGTYYKAIKPLEQAIAIEPNFVLAHARLAEVWGELDYADRAQVETLRVDSLVPNRTALSQLDALYLDSIRSAVTRDIPAAIKANEAIVKLRPDDAQAYTDLARAFERNDQLDDAISNYETALRFDNEHPAALFRLGILYGRKQDESAANTAFGKADALFQTLGEFEGRAEVLYQRGIFLKSMSRFPEAEDQLRKALEMSRTSNNQPQQIGSMLALSAVLSLTGKTEPAGKMAIDAVNLAESSGIENLASQGLIDLGLAYLVRRDYADSEQVLRQALDIARRNNGHRNEARALLALAKLYLQQETRVDESMGYLNQASAFFEKGGYQADLTESVLFLGRAKLLKADYDGALNDFQHVITLAKRINDRAQLANAYVLIGNVLRDREDYPKALDNFEESDKLFADLGIPLSMGYLIIDRAKMYWRLGRYEDADRALGKIPRVLDRLDSVDYRHVIMARDALVRAEIAASRQDFGPARAKAQESISLAGSQPNYTTVEAESLLGLVLVRSGARAKGLQLSRQAVDMAKQINDEHLLSQTMLGEAEALLENDKAEEALAQALDCQQRFARGGQLESEWRAWLIAARASELLGDSASSRREADEANRRIVGLREQWKDVFKGYETRIDIKSALSQAKQIIQ